MKDSGIEAVLSDSEGSEAVLLVTLRKMAQAWTRSGRPGLPILVLC